MPSETGQLHQVGSRVGSSPKLEAGLFVTVFTGVGDGTVEMNFMGLGSGRLKKSVPALVQQLNETEGVLVGCAIVRAILIVKVGIPLLPSQHQSPFGHHRIWPQVRM